MPNTDNTQNATLTMEDYLRGKVATPIPDNTLASIMAEVGVQKGSAYDTLTDKEKDLCLAGLYV